VHDSTAFVRAFTLYRWYFDLVAAGTRTIEVRGKTHTSPISPSARQPNSHPRHGQITNIRAIYPPAKEALHILANENRPLS
jgi:hypothetical protein